MKPTCVIVDGPFPEQDRHGDEFPTWTVFRADDNSDEVESPVTCFSYETAISLAEQIHQRSGGRLELVIEASRA